MKDYEIQDKKALNQSPVLAGRCADLGSPFLIAKP